MPSERDHLRAHLAALQSQCEALITAEHGRLVVRNLAWIYKRVDYFHGAWPSLRSIPRDDLVQSAALIALQGMHKYDPTRATPTTWLTWCVRIAMLNEIKKAARRPANRYPDALEDAGLPADLMRSRLVCQPDHAASDARDEAARTSSLIHRAIASLAPMQARVVRLVHLEGFSQNGAAFVMGVSKQRVQKLLALAIPRLRRILEGEKGVISA